MIRTQTPAGDPQQPYAFNNLLDPAGQLYDPSGNLVAQDDNSAPDGKNALSVTVFEEHPPFTNNPGAARMIPLFRERATKANVPYPHVETQVAGSWAAWQVLEAAMTATKSLDDKAMAQWLRKNRVDTIIGKLRFDGPNNYGDDLFKVKQVQDGKWVVVWPREFAAPGTRLLPP